MKSFNCILVGLAALTVSSIPLRADTLRNAGVLGNSGEQGTALVRFGEKEASGLGIAFDRHGSLWDRGGSKTLNRYGVDGRLLATYPLPDHGPNRNADGLTLAGDTLILRLGSGLYVLPIDAPPGTAPTSLKINADYMSPSARDGWVAAADKGEIFLANAAGERKPIAKLTSNPSGIEFGPDGAVYVRKDEKMLRVTPGNAEPTAAGPVPGERAQFLAGAWYGSAWASTLRRFDDGLRPSPGVVLGGNSGSFIGHVDEQAEIINSRGLAQVSSDVFAISGLAGVVHLVQWSPADRRMTPVRRLGAVQTCDALGLDRDGRIWHAAGSWEWTDGPATPLRFGIPAGDTYAIAMLDSDVMVAFGRLHGKPAFYAGKLTTEAKHQRVEKASNLPEGAVAIVPVQITKRNAVLILSPDGSTTTAHVGADGRYESDADPIALVPATPVKRWTSLAAIDAGHLIGAADGQVIELKRDGDRYKEIARWNSWGDNAAKESFGPTIKIAADAGRLWVADTAKHRVVCLDAATRKFVATFGTTDAPGDDLQSFNGPTTLAVRGQRAVVFDKGNQRIVKLELAAGKNE